MNEVIKQRLVGALILVALGVVFWPIIFVEKTGEGPQQTSRMPSRPAIDTSPIEPPSQAGLRASPELSWEEPVEETNAEPEAAEAPVVAIDSPAADTSAPASSPAERSTRSEAPAQPVLDSEGVPVAWILQVASVSSSGKANELRDRLLQMNFKAYVKKLERGDNDLYRVYIGPKFEQAQLQRMQAQIDSEFGVKSIVARYVP